MAFFIGLWVGLAIGSGVIFWLTFNRRSPFLTIDPWWLENEDRWSGLRPVLIAERQAEAAAPSASEGPET